MCARCPSVLPFSVSLPHVPDLRVGSTTLYHRSMNASSLRHTIISLMQCGSNSDRKARGFIPLFSVLQKCWSHPPLICYQSAVTRRMRRSSHTELQCRYLISTQIDSSPPRQLRRGQRAQPSKIQLVDYATILRVPLLARCSRHLQCMPRSLSARRARSGLNLTCRNMEYKCWDHRRCNQVRVSLPPPDPELNTSTKFCPA